MRQIKLAFLSISFNVLMLIDTPISFSISANIFFNDLGDWFTFAIILVVSFIDCEIKLRYKLVLYLLN